MKSPVMYKNIKFIKKRPDWQIYKFLHDVSALGTGPSQVLL